MKLTQRIPLQLFNTYTYELGADRVILRWNSWTNSGQIEYPYDSIKQISSTVTSEAAFRNWALGAFVLSMLSTISQYAFGKNVELILFLAFLAIAGIFWLLSLWKLYKLDVFRDDKGYALFSIRAIGQDEVDFMREIKSKLKLQ